MKTVFDRACASALRNIRQQIFVDKIDLPKSIFVRQFSSVAMFEFDKYMYALVDDPFQFSLGIYGSSFGVEVVGADKEMIESTYAIDPIAKCDFFSSRYNDFLFAELNGGAHRIELLADELLWFDLDGRWGAYGSRDLGLVIVGADTDFTSGGARTCHLSRETSFGILSSALDSEFAAKEFLAVLEAKYCLITS